MRVKLVMEQAARWIELCHDKVCPEMSENSLEFLQDLENIYR